MSTFETPEEFGSFAEPPKPGFKLSLINWLLFGLISSVYVVVYCLRGDFSPKASGFLTGSILSYMLFPGVLALIAYALGRRSLRAANITFNVVILLAAVGQLNAFNRRAEQNQIVKKMEADREAFKAELLNLDETGDATQAVDKYTTAVADNFDQMAAKGTDQERRFFRVMGSYLKEVQQVQTEWGNAFDAAQTAEMFDFSGLTDDAEFERRRKTVQTYLDATRKYGDMMQNMVVQIEAKLRSEPGLDSRMVKGAIDGARSKHAQQAAAFASLMAAHLDYGQTILAVQTLLHSNLSKWEQAGNQVSFKDDRLQNQFNEKIQKLQDLEEQINRLAMEVRKVL